MAGTWGVNQQLGEGRPALCCLDPCHFSKGKGQRGTDTLLKDTTEGGGEQQTPQGRAQGSGRGAGHEGQEWGARRPGAAGVHA